MASKGKSTGKTPPKRKPGRPSKLTPSLQRRVATYLRRGHYIEVVCPLVGVSKATFYSWLNKGHQGIDESPVGPNYVGFLDAVTKAMAVAEDKMLKKVNDAAMDGDVQMAKFMLQHRYGRRWQQGGKSEVLPGQALAGLTSDSPETQRRALVRFLVETMVQARAEGKTSEVIRITREIAKLNASYPTDRQRINSLREGRNLDEAQERANEAVAQVGLDVREELAQSPADPEPPPPGPEPAEASEGGSA